MERTSRQAKVEELKAVAEKLPAANVLLLRRVLSLLQHIGHNASTSRMSASNLAICVGPNLLSPANENTLTLEAMVQVTEKVNVLVEFMIENHCEIFGEEMAGLPCPSAEESPAPMDRCTELPSEEERGPAGDADVKHQAKGCLEASPSLLVLREAEGADMEPGLETAEVWQVHKQWDNVSRVRGYFLMSPGNCCASSRHLISCGFVLAFFIPQNGTL
ncbi:rho GTPase-activating protein 19-like [Pluvialis apricaria]